MTRLTQLHDLLTEHGGTLSYAALAGMMDTTLKTIATLMAQATRLDIARNIAPMGRREGGMAQLFPNAVAPTGRLPTIHRRQSEALTLLFNHPAGLTQQQLNDLTGWGHSGVTDCMCALEAAGSVSVTGGVPRRPKIYTLPQAGTVPQAAPVAPRPALRRSVPPPAPVVLTGELGAARKLVAGLRVKSARGLACAGNYKLSRAEELFAQLEAGGWL